MKDRCRNRLDAKYPMRLAFSNVKPRFRSFVEAKKFFCITVFFFLFLLTFAQFSWVAVILTDKVFERFWIAQETG